MPGCEQYFNLFSTTVATGGYTAGSGVLNVAATAGITLNSGDSCRLLVYRIIGGVLTPIVLLKATVVNSSTQFAVTAEGSDANALVTDVVLNVQSIGGQNQIRKDQDGLDVYSNLPSTSSAHQGDRYDPTDTSSNYEYVFNGSVWVPRLRQSGNVTLPPAAASWGWLAQNSASLSDLAGGGLQLSGPPSGTNLAGATLAAPSTPYTITIGVSLVGFGGPTFGMFFYNSGDSRLVLFHLNTGATSNTATALNVTTSKWHIGSGNFSFDAVYSNNSSNPFQIFIIGSLLYLRITDDGTNLKFSYGADPNTFTQFDSRTRHDWMAAGPTHYGIHLGAGTSGFPPIANVLHHKQT